MGIEERVSAHTKHTNVKVFLRGSILVIEVDTSKNHGRSRSHKHILIAATDRTMPVPGSDMTLQLQVTRPWSGRDIFGRP